MAEKELNSDYFIKHHLQNLTFGQCSDGKWRFADGHINLGAEHTVHQEKAEYTCDPKEMGFNAIHVDTMLMSLLLGGLFCFYFGRWPEKLQWPAQVNYKMQLNTPLIL